MATLYIREYLAHPFGQNGLGMQAGSEPGSDQTVAITGSSVQSVTFAASTKWVRLHCDAICSVKFGTNPTATQANARMATNQTEYFGLVAGQGLMVAVIANT